jgi:hypothetical protein
LKRRQVTRLYYAEHTTEIESAELEALARRIALESGTGDLGLIRRVDRETGKTTYELLPWTLAELVVIDIPRSEPNVGRASLRRIAAPPESPGAKRYEPDNAKKALFYVESCEQPRGV